MDAIDASWNTDADLEMGNMGHRAGVKGVTSKSETWSRYKIRNVVYYEKNGNVS